VRTFLIGSERTRRLNLFHHSTRLGGKVFAPTGTRRLPAGAPCAATLNGCGTRFYFAFRFSVIHVLPAAMRRSPRFFLFLDFSDQALGCQQQARNGGGVLQG